MSMLLIQIKRFSFLWHAFSSLVCSETISYAHRLVSGPMPGLVGMQEALIWVQTESAGSVNLRYWILGDSANSQQTDPIHVGDGTDFTTHVRIFNLVPGKIYAY